jgi:hypothetical protein
MTNFWPWPWNRFFSTPPIVITRVVGIVDTVREAHLVYFGGSGTGKTKHLEGLLTMDFLRRALGLCQRGWACIDVHGDFGNELIGRLAILCQQFPQMRDQVVVIDPTIEGWTVGYNPFELRPGEVAERRARGLADTLITVFKDDPTMVVRMYRVAYYSFLALILTRRYLTDMPEFLTNRTFREELVLPLSPHYPDIIRYWTQELPTDREAIVRVESTANRIGRLVSDPDVAPMFEHSSTLNFRELMDKGAFVIIRLPKGILGQDVAYMLAALLVAEFERAAMSRADIPKEDRKPFALVCDEFVNYLTPSFQTIVDECRKMRLELIAATQNVESHLGSDELLASFLNSVNNICAFRLGWKEADSLVREVFQPELDQVKESYWQDGRVAGFAIPRERKVWRGLDEIWEIERRKIMTLKRGELWWREKSNQKTRKIKAFHIHDVSDMPDAHLLPGARAALLDAVYRRYGSARVRIEPSRVEIIGFLPDKPPPAPPRPANPALPFGEPIDE